MDKSGEKYEENMLCDIERLVKGSKFSRDEFNHLVELLNSRAVDLPKVELGKENVNLISREHDECLAIAHHLPNVYNERKHEEPKRRVICGSSTPLCLSNVQDQIHASPIEIARIYMDSRLTEAGPNSKRMIQTVESTVLHGVEAVVKPYDPSSYVKTSTCWPGVVVHSAYTTPQGQRSRHKLANFHRTPYSRNLHSKSKTRLTRVEGDYSNISSTPPSQSQRVYLQEKSIVDASETGYGSFGPIHRINHKFGAQFLFLKGPSKRESYVVNEAFTPTVTNSLDPDERSIKNMGCEVGVPAVHTHSSLMAKKILEHIDRSLPTPKEKSAELTLATKWKSHESSSNITTFLSNENNGLQKLNGVSEHRYDVPEVKKLTPSNEDRRNCHVDILLRERTDKSIGIREDGTLLSDMNVCGSIPAVGNEANSMHSYGCSQTFGMKSTEEDTLKPLPCGGDLSEISRKKKPLTNSSASKPVITPISIKKHESRWTSASENGSVFTFPVSTSSSLFSEPPTPSIMPLFWSRDQNQSRERSTELSYSFGLKKSNPVLVFSFPFSTSNSSVPSDAGVIKFNFGSKGKARLSLFPLEKMLFSVDKNAI